MPELKPLSEANCMELFATIAKFSADDEPFVRKLIREVECHTMTVELLARTLNAAWKTLSARELLKLLRQGRLDAAELPKIMHEKNFSEREAKIYGHLRTLFKIAYSDEYREILCDLTLLPPDEDYIKRLGKVFIFASENLERVGKLLCCRIYFL